MGIKGALGYWKRDMLSHEYQKSNMKISPLPSIQEIMGYSTRPIESGKGDLPIILRSLSVCPISVLLILRDTLSNTGMESRFQNVSREPPNLIKKTATPSGSTL